MQDKVLAAIGGATLMAMAIGIVVIMKQAEGNSLAMSTSIAQKEKQANVKIVKAEGKKGLVIDCGKGWQIIRCAQGYATPAANDTADHLTLKEMTMRAFYGQGLEPDYSNVNDKFVNQCHFDHHGAQSMQFGSQENYNVLIAECAK